MQTAGHRHQSVCLFLIAFTACTGRLKLGEMESPSAGRTSVQPGTSSSSAGSDSGTDSTAGRTGAPVLVPSAGKTATGGTSALQGGGMAGMASISGTGLGGQTVVPIVLPTAGMPSIGGASGGPGNGAAGVAGTALDGYRISAVALGLDYSCAIVDGGLRCWGNNENGKLGTNSSDPNRVTPTAVEGMENGVTKVSASGDFTCAVVNGAARCWGENSAGQLGDGTTTPRPVSTQVDGLQTGVTEIVAGGQHACAVIDGAAQCWGDNSLGQLGNGSLETSLVPVPVLGLSQGVTSIAAGPGYSCAVVSGGARCWGDNTYGQLGNNSTTASPLAVPVFGITRGATAISAGVTHSCALVEGIAMCWGHDIWANYQWGIDDIAFDSLVPVPLNDGRAGWFQGISAGESHTCAWGDFNSGGICWGTSLPGNAGYRNAGFVPVFFATGNRHDCAVAVYGSLYCWGSNDFGQLGIGSTLDSDTPVKVIF